MTGYTALGDKPLMPSGAPAGPVSVVVVSYYTGPLLQRCLAATLAQPQVGELVVVDNGNWDRTRDDLTGLARDDARLRVLSGHGNIGFAAACNLGVAASAHPYVLILNPDAVPAPGAIGALLREAETAAPDGLWLAGGRLLNPDGTEQAGARRRTLTPWRAMVEMARLDRLAPRHPYFQRFNAHDEPCPGRATPMPTVSGAFFMLPRAAWEAVGGMDEGFFLHVEDIDLCLRFGQAGGTVLYVPGAEVVHGRSSSRSNRIRVERWKAQSLARYFRRHFRGVYPPGFVSLVVGMVWGVFGARSAGIAGRRALAILGLGRRAGLGRAARAARLGRSAAGR